MLSKKLIRVKSPLAKHDKRYGVDCPVAETLTLDVIVEAPIFAEERVLNKATINVPV